MSSALVLYAGRIAAQNDPGDPLNNPQSLPFGIFPRIESVQDQQRPNDDLKSEIKDLSAKVSDTVKTFATRRNFSCFGRPCLLQAFPLLYTNSEGGFFGGFRANIRDISRLNPPLYSLDLHIVRSDNAQWTTYAALDFPQVTSLPFAPRIKFRGLYQRTTTIRYFGIGKSAEASRSRPDQELRYALKDSGAEATVSVPVLQFAHQNLSIFASFNGLQERPSPFTTGPSKLYEDHPEGADGGTSSRFGLGILIDTRDRERVTTRGWSTEISGEIAGHPIGDFDFQRFSFIDKRYFSLGRATFAFRTTVDSLSGDIPFWELEGVGGYEPILYLSGSGILRGFLTGRFHERFKILGSGELRWRFPPQRVFKQYTEITAIPLAIDFGRLGDETAASATIGLDTLMNRSFLIRLYVSRAELRTSINLGFDKEF